MSIHSSVGLRAQRAVDGHAPLPLHGRGRHGEQAPGIPRIHAADQPVPRQRRVRRTAHPAAIQLRVCVEQGGPRPHRRSGVGLSHHALVDYSTMTKRHLSRAVLLCAAALASCDKNTVQDITGPLAASRVKFFNFGVSAPGVNFYANATKLTAITSGTGTESTGGVAYGGTGNGGLYSAIASGQYTLTGRIADTTGGFKDRPVDT